MRRDAFMLAALTALAVTPGRARAGGVTIGRPSFGAATAEIEASIERDRTNPQIEAAALPRLSHHGAVTDTAVVFFHGFTNCPQQFQNVARRFYDRGCNVYVPRIPLHGYADRMTDALENLNTAMLEQASTDGYRLATGLGRRVAAVGLSLGGTMALYLAQTQPIDHAVPIAPFLTPIGFPDWLGLAGMQLLSWLPNRYLWWDPRIKENCRPLYAYPGFPSHALANCVFFGNEVVAASRTGAPAAGRGCTMVLNQTESAVNNNVASALIDRWNAAGAHYDAVVLSGLGRRHDIIDPTTFPAAETLVYPRLEQIVLGAGATG